MNLDIQTLILIASGIVVGIGLGIGVTFLILKKNVKKRGEQIIKNAEREASAIRDKRHLEAKERFLQLKADFESSTNERNKQMVLAENRIKQKEQSTNQKLEQLQR